MSASPDTRTSDTLARLPGRLFALCGTVFILAAVVVAIVQAVDPITLGWWLVAYLSLVGGVAQIMLGSGLLALAERADGHAPSANERLAELVLWNVGTLIVAVADLANAPLVVLVGSAALLAALAFFAAGLNRIHATAAHPPRLWIRLYVVLLVFLAVSTAVGSVLSHKS